jgi:hypothetical protein
VESPQSRCSNQKAEWRTVVLLRGADLEPDAAEPGEGAEIGAGDMAGIVPEEAAGERGEIGEEGGGEEEKPEPRHAEAIGVAGAIVAAVGWGDLGGRGMKGRNAEWRIGECGVQKIRNGILVLGLQSSELFRIFVRAVVQSFHDEKRTTEATKGTKTGGRKRKAEGFTTENAESTENMCDAGTGF